MQRPRTPSKLSESLHRRLNSYALAASAAGVSLVALAQPSQAKIVYTPAHVKINLQNLLYPLDLNHDGFVDVSLGIGYAEGHSFVSVNLYAAPPLSAPKVNAVLGLGSNDSNLRAGALIGTAHQVFWEARYMAGFWSDTRGRHTFRGLWANGGKGVKNRYLGFRFAINGRTHYGWARLNVGFTDVRNFQEVSGLLTGYAYETIPNKSIIAGKTHGKDVITIEPASLGHLARGAAAIPTWRYSDAPHRLAGEHKF